MNAVQQVEVVETFDSIQGESSFAGLTCHFIRLAHCNLRCRYCDTTQAYGPGRMVPVEQLVSEAAAARTAIVEVTGGEPLLQKGFPLLAARLHERAGKPVLVETNGSQDISLVPRGGVSIVDVKSPGSGEGGSFDLANIARLRAHDEVKFVLCDRADYEWARGFVLDHGLVVRCRWVLFSAAQGLIELKRLGQWILEDGLPVRLQVQLHKIIEVA